MAHKLNRIEEKIPTHVDVRTYFESLCQVWQEIDTVEYFSNVSGLRIILGRKFRVDLEHRQLVFRCQQGCGYTTKEWQELLLDKIPNFPEEK